VYIFFLKIESTFSSYTLSIVSLYISIYMGQVFDVVMPMRRRWF
jgi:hypothetical protein